eukprot:GHRR01037748.1.p1 GENE.GHRR01037748.1~~GHRR01037748.1.p1  ORF type:complete len:144 (+),score=19.70 GHRR01037748.1:169-600(+)
MVDILPGASAHQQSAPLPHFGLTKVHRHQPKAPALLKAQSPWCPAACKHNEHSSKQAYLLKMISRSSSVVTGFSLHTNSMLLGGLTSASGKSPIISSTTALFWASAARASFSTSSAGRSSTVGTQSSSRRSPCRQRQQQGMYI